jgi:hypothetical protein
MLKKWESKGVLQEKQVGEVGMISRNSRNSRIKEDDDQRMSVDCRADTVCLSGLYGKCWFVQALKPSSIFFDHNNSSSPFSLHHTSPHNLR